jgi:hypothetical protein
MIFHRTQNYLKRIKEIEELGPKVWVTTVVEWGNFSIIKDKDGMFQYLLRRKLQQKLLEMN